MSDNHNVPADLNVLFLTPSGETLPSVRFRVLPFVEAGRAAGLAIDWRRAPKAIHKRLLFLFTLPRARVIVIQQKLFAPFELALIRRRCQRLVYDVDDALWALHPAEVGQPGSGSGSCARGSGGRSSSGGWRERRGCSWGDGRRDAGAAGAHAEGVLVTQGGPGWLAASRYGTLACLPQVALTSCLLLPRDKGSFGIYSPLCSMSSDAFARLPSACRMASTALWSCGRPLRCTALWRTSC